MVLLQPTGLFWASFALLLSAMISLLLQLKITRSLLWAGIRAFLQLFVLGMVLTWVFRHPSGLTEFALILVMTSIAAYTVLDRVSDFGFRGVMVQIFLSLILGGWLFSAYASRFVLQEGAWRKAEVIIPFAGLLLGNSLSGISLGLIYWVKSLRDQVGWIETRLAHGASRWEATQPLFQEAIRTAMTPVLNSMSVAGVVSIPGMMTGQLLAGADPSSAVAYQIAALFLITASTFFGITFALFLGYRSIFNSHHQFVYSEAL